MKQVQWVANCGGAQLWGQPDRHNTGAGLNYLARRGVVLLLALAWKHWLHLPLTGWVFFACSDPVSDKLHRTPTPITPTYGHIRVKSFGWICCI